ncbi:hypothetical protein LXL04_035798 [Taraxacum kok-saghyz]
MVVLDLLLILFLRIFIKQTLMNSPTFVLTLSKLIQSQISIQIRTRMWGDGLPLTKFRKAVPEMGQGIAKSLHREGVGAYRNPSIAALLAVVTCCAGDGGVGFRRSLLFRSRRLRLAVSLSPDASLSLSLGLTVVLDRDFGVVFEAVE